MFMPVSAYSRRVPMVELLFLMVPIVPPATRPAPTAPPARPAAVPRPVLSSTPDTPPSTVPPPAQVLLQISEKRGLFTTVLELPVSYLSKALPASPYPLVSLNLPPHHSRVYSGKLGQDSREALQRNPVFVGNHSMWIPQEPLQRNPLQSSSCCVWLNHFTLSGSCWGKSIVSIRKVLQYVIRRNLLFVLLENSLYDK